MPNTHKRNEEFFDSIAPKVQTSPVMITTKNQIKKTALGRWGAVFVVLFVASAALGVYLLKQYQSKSGELKNLKQQEEQGRQALAQESVLDKIGRHLVLPQNQQPAVVTIQDAEGLKAIQPFYSQVKDGDQLVTFQEMQIVYDPLADKIVYVRPLVSQATATPAQTGGLNFFNPTAPVRAITLDIRNGAAMPGLAARTAAALGKEATYQVLKIGNAQKQIYTKTVIVNLKGRDVSNLEARFGVKAVAQLPLGELTSTADVVLILGK
jgi:hypothetical protein